MKYNSIAIITHYSTSVPFDDLLKYLLLKRVDKIISIKHPLFIGKNSFSHCDYYHRNSLVYRKTCKRNPYIPMVLQYCIDLLLNLYWIYFSGITWEIVVALNNLNTLSGLLLKSFGKIKKVVYYTIDFTPQKYQNKIMNDIYHNLDKLAVRFADLTWNVSKEIQIGRKTIRNLIGEEYQKQIIVPIGIWKLNLKNIPLQKAPTIVYAGGIENHQGLQLMIESIPELLKDFPSLKLLVIGRGTYLDSLQELAARLKIEKNIKWLGYFEEHSEIFKILNRSSIAIALYHPELSKWSKYADPSKIKSYLSAGLPVITTNVTYMSKIINDKMGISINYSQEELISSIKLLLKNNKLRKKYSRNAKKYIESFYWINIFDKAFSKIDV